MREVDGKFQIISGHHRWLAAQQAGINSIPCWIKDLTDERAYMELVLCNTQSELHPLEEGKHAAESWMDLKAYAEASGKKRTTLQDKMYAYEVMAAVPHVRHEEIRDSWRNLAEIHAAYEWLWSTLVKQMIESGWTVQVTRDKVAAFKECDDPPVWSDSGKIANALVSGAMKVAEVAKLQLLVDNAKVSGEFRSHLITTIESESPSLLSEVQTIVAEWEKKQADAEESERQEKLIKQRSSENAPNYFSIFLQKTVDKKFSRVSYQLQRRKIMKKARHYDEKVVAFRPSKAQVNVLARIKIPARNSSDFYRKIFEVGLTILSANAVQ